MLTDPPSGSMVTTTVSYRDVWRQMTLAPDAMIRSQPRICSLMEAFVAQNEDPATSSNFQSQTQDDVTPLGEAVLQDALRASTLRVLKILTRKPINRTDFPSSLILSLAISLEKYHGIAYISEVTDLANIILNVSYLVDNIQPILLTSIPRILIGCLRAFAEEQKALAAIAGALQSICFVNDGKRAVTDGGGIPPLVALLWHGDETVRARAIGAVHNISADISTLDEIEACGAIDPLVVSLRNPDLLISGPAAGCLQNLSRNERIRLELKDRGAVEPLTALLCCNEISVQTYALGALFNVLMPDAEATEAGRRALKRTLSLSMALSITYHALFTEDDDDGLDSPGASSVDDSGS